MRFVHLVVAVGPDDEETDPGADEVLEASASADRPIGDRRERTMGWTGDEAP
jgi:hypothetical protein